MIAAALSFLYLFRGQPGPDDTVAVIDNEEVTVQEFRQQILSVRGEVMAYFREKYGAESGQGFWTNSYGGEIPSEVAKEKAMAQVIKNKEQLILAKNKGFLKNAGYKDILKEMKAENKRRKNAVRAGEVIYGQLEFNEETYFEYVMAGIERELKESMSEQWNVTEQEIKGRYDEMKEDFYTEGRKVRIKKIQLSYGEEDGTVNKALMNKQKNRIEKIMEQLRKGKDFETAASELEEGPEGAEQVFDTQTADRDARLNPELREISSEMKPGQVSDIIEESNSFYIVKCVENTPLTYTPLEEVKDNIEQICIDEKYRTFIEGMADKAVVEINKKVYDKIDKSVSLV